MKIRPFILIYLSVLLIFLIPVQSSSQSAAELLAQDQGFVIPDTVVAFSSTEVPTKSEEYLGFISDIRSSFPDTVTLQLYKTDLETSQAIIQEMLDDSTLADLENVAIRRLDNIQRKTFRNRVKMTATLDKIRELSRSLENNWQQSIYIQNAWELTRDDENNQDIPDALKQRINLVLSDNEVLINDIKQILEDVIALEDYAMQQINEADQFLARINQSKTQSHKLLLQKSYPPIWKSREAADEKILFSERLHIISKDYNNGFKEFYRNYKTTLFIHLIIFIIILTLLLILRKMSKEWVLDEEDESFNAFLYIFSRPVAAALLIAFLMYYFLYPKAPIVIDELIALLIIVPSIILVMGVVKKRYHSIIFTVLILYVLQWISSTITIESELPPRLYILVQTLVTGVFVIWWLRPGSIIYDIRRFCDSRIFTVVGLAAVVLLFIAVIANVLGYMEIAFYFTSNVILAATYAVILYLSVYVLEGLITVIFYGIPSDTTVSEREKNKKFRKRTRAILRFFASLFWIVLVMEDFFILDSVATWLTKIINTSWLIGKIDFSLKRLLLFLLIILMSIYITRLIRILFEKNKVIRLKLPRGVPDMISLILRYLLVFIGFLMALAVLGIDLDNLTILLGAVGVGIGFGLQSFFNNLISGFILVFERPLQVGDVVKFANMEGKIKRIGVRSSTIRTYEGSEVIVPNGHLVSNELTNLTLSDPLARLEVEVGVAYGSNPHQVIDLLVEAATSNKEVIRIPKPFAIFVRFGDSSLDFRLYFWTNKINERLRIRSEVNLAVHDALDEAKITIPFPQRDLHFKQIPKGGLKTE